MGSPDKMRRFRDARRKPRSIEENTCEKDGPGVHWFALIVCGVRALHGKQEIRTARTTEALYS